MRLDCQGTLEVSADRELPPGVVALSDGVLRPFGAAYPWLLKPRLPVAFGWIALLKEKARDAGILREKVRMG